MKEFFKMFFASLLAVVVSSVVLIFIVIGIIVGLAKSVTEKESKPAEGNVLMVDLSKGIHELSETNPLASFNKSESFEPGLYDIVKALSHAKTDEKIKGVFIKLSHTPNGWATLQQLRLALEDFKLSKKFIYAYGEDIPQAAYFVASVADSIYLNPVGDIELKGFATILAYLKGTLDKLDLQPEIFYAGKFKSATEPFRAERISDPNRIQIQAYQYGLWEQFLLAASEYMHTPKDNVNKLAIEGAIQFPQDALKYKMVAGLLYWDEVESRLKNKAGMQGRGELKFVPIENYAMTQRNDTKMSENRIGLLFAEGNIVDGDGKEEYEIASKTFCEQIRKVRNDDRIKAVVLRVNSPGGSALASEVILRELNLLKKKKPLVVSMGDYAASGGYYISCEADSIFALPNTLTGSIGVFSMMFDISKMMRNKLGVAFDEVKNAPYADVPTALRPLTAAEGKRIQNAVDTVYNTFKSHVANGRRMSLAQVDEIAQGRVWTGTDAHRVHLADGLGGMGRALKSAARMAKLNDYKVVTFPEPTDKLNAMLKKFKSNASITTGVKTAIKEEFGDEFELYEKIHYLRQSNGKAMMAMPYVLEVR